MKVLVAVQGACLLVLMWIAALQTTLASPELLLQQELLALRTDLRELLVAPREASSHGVPRAASLSAAEPAELAHASQPASLDATLTAGHEAAPPRRRLDDAYGERLAALEGLVQQLRAHAPSASAASHVTALAARQRPAADWVALDRWRAEFERDRAAASGGLLLLMPADVIERFGRPTSISVANERIQWIYTRDRQQVMVTMADGLVVAAHAR